MFILIVGVKSSHCSVPVSPHNVFIILTIPGIIGPNAFTSDLSAPSTISSADSVLAVNLITFVILRYRNTNINVYEYYCVLI